MSDRYRNNQEHVPQVGDVVQFEEGGRLTPVLDVMACDGDMQVRVDWGGGPPKIFALIRPAPPAPADCECRLWITDQSHGAVWEDHHQAGHHPDCPKGKTPAPVAEGVTIACQSFAMESLKQRLEERESELAQLRTENAGLKAQEAAWRKTIDDVMANTEYAASELTASRAQVAQLQARLREVEARMRRLADNWQRCRGMAPMMADDLRTELTAALAPSPCKVEQPASVISSADSGVGRSGDAGTGVDLSGVKVGDVGEFLNWSVATVYRPLGLDGDVEWRTKHNQTFFTDRFGKCASNPRCDIIRLLPAAAGPSGEVGT